jgi:6-phosphogluconolactonase
MSKTLSVFALCFCVSVVGVRGQPTGGTLVYIGTYTGAKSKGIHAFRFNQTTGALTPIGLAAETPSPSWVVLHPSGQYLYAANEVDDFDADNSGSVTAFGIDRASGALTPLNTQPSRGAHPCHLAVDRSGTHLLVANYTGGTLAVLPLERDGSLGAPTQVVQHKGSSINTARQRSPHAHSIDLDADNRFAISADLGADRLFIYRYDSTGGGLLPGLRPAIAATPGAGPRHFAFHPNGRFGFAINELASTITSYSWDARRGALNTLATISTLPDGFRRESSTAEIRVHPNGRFLYGSNRGHDSIAVYQVGPNSGYLTLVEHELTRGKTPRNFTIDPSGQWLIAANQNSDTLAVFRISDRNGGLTPVGALVKVGAPVSVVFVPS